MYMTVPIRMYVRTYIHVDVYTYICVFVHVCTTMYTYDVPEVSKACSHFYLILPITADVLYVYVRKCVICTYVNVCMRRLSYMYVCIHVNMG